VTEFCEVQNSLCVQVLRSPILAALLHGTRAVGVSQTLRRGTRNGIIKLSLLIIFNKGSHHVLVFIMVALWNRANHYIFALWFLSFFFLLFFLA